MLVGIEPGRLPQVVQASLATRSSGVSPLAGCWDQDTLAVVGGPVSTKGEQRNKSTAMAIQNSWRQSSDFQFGAGAFLNRLRLPLLVPVVICLAATSLQAADPIQEIGAQLARTA